MHFDYRFRDYVLHFGDETVRMQAATNFEACVDQMFATDAFSEDMCPYGAALWPAAIALCHTLRAEQALVANKRVLELGCGLGLGAIVAKKLGADVVASDFHPDMEALFRRNCQLNDVDIPYLRFDWAQPAPSMRFDTIIASDVLYDNQVAPLCLSVINSLLSPGGHVVLSDPQRGQLTRARAHLKDAGFRWSEHAQHVDLADQSADCIVFLATR